MPHTVVQLASFRSPYPGNFVAALRSVDAGLRARGWRHVLAFDARAREHPWPEQLADEGFELDFLPPPRTASTRTLTAEVLRIARSAGATLLHAHFAEYDLSAWLAQQRLRLGGRRVGLIWHVHSPVPQTGNRAVKDLLKFRLMGRSAHMIPVAYPIETDLLRRGVAPERIGTIPNGVDFSHATASTSAPRADLRAALDLPAEAPVAVSFGWDAHRKGVDLLLDAGAELVRDHPAFHLVLVGEAQMEAFIDEHLAPEGRPSWLRVVPPRKTVADFYHLADLFVLASRKEGLPYAVGEALANGLPVVSSRIEGMSEWATGAPGIAFFDSGDSAGLREAIAAVLGWPSDHRAAMAEANRALVDEHLSLRTWTERTLAVYDRLLTT